MAELKNKTPNEKALLALNECEWIDDYSGDGHYLTSSSGYDCDDASDFLTKYHQVIREALTIDKDITQILTKMYQYAHEMPVRNAGAYKNYDEDIKRAREVIEKLEGLNDD